MLGTGLQFGRMRGQDRFYIPTKARKHQNQFQRHASERSRNDGFESPNSSTERKTGALENGKPKEVAILVDRPSQDSSVASHSNLERFLESTTPSVPAQYLSKTTMKGWKTCDVEFQPYFLLGDLWESFKEWSAYGAGVPLLLDGSDSVIQYYVPYLSGIQIYGPLKHRNPKSRSSSEDSDGDYYNDSSSDGSSEYEIEKGVKSCHSTNEISFKIGGLSLSDEQSSGQEGFSSDDGEGGGSSRGCLLFEYLERDPPYSREPLANKIMDLARQFPALNTIRSCDLLPCSWISVAWYPIYRIPTGPTLKDLDACFLMYHTLSTRAGGSGGAQSPVIVQSREMESVPKIRLPITGMATYKLKGSMWTQNAVHEHHRANFLTQDADNLLRHLGVNHPDFQFFVSHGIYLR